VNLHLVNYLKQEDDKKNQLTDNIFFRYMKDQVYYHLN